MKYLYWILGLIVIGGILYLIMTNLSPSLPDTVGGADSARVEINPISHASFVLELGDTVVYNDPVGGAELFAQELPPHLILITDIHGDHMDPDTLSALSSAAIIVAPSAVRDQLPDALAARVQVMDNGASATHAGIRITAIPAYNLPDAENAERHPKGRGNGYLLERDGTRIYIAGDTAGTSEMRALTDINIAFIPMNLPYTMSVEEAADAVLAFKPKKIYPYHYRTPEGFADVNRFKELVNAGDPSLSVLLMDWYPYERKGWQ